MVLIVEVPQAMPSGSLRHLAEGRIVASSTSTILSCRLERDRRLSDIPFTRLFYPPF